MNSSHYFCLLLVICSLFSSCSNRYKTSKTISIKDLTGTYIMKYTGETNENGWDYNQINRTELLKIADDSTYYWELKYPLGCFPVLTQHGKISISQNTFTLKSGEKFKVIGDQLFTTNDFRNELNEAPWVKQD